MYHESKERTFTGTATAGNTYPLMFSNGKGHIINGAHRMIVVRIIFTYMLSLYHITPLSSQNPTVYVYSHL